MGACRLLPSAPECARSGLRVGLAVVILLLVFVPALDLAGVEPTFDQGGRCQLHANPAVVIRPASLIVSTSAKLPLVLPPLPRLPLLGSSIFIPPRA